MNDAGLAFYASPGMMTRLPTDVSVEDIPRDIDEMRRCVRGLVLHPAWAPAYGVPADAIRPADVQCRSTVEVLERAFALAAQPITERRPPVDRVMGNCRHFAVLYVAFLRAHGVAARARCGFASYFDRSKWLDHWIVERWNGERWVRDDPQVDTLQRKAVNLDIDPYDQPPREFLTGAEAWTATRVGEFDPLLFGIENMWGQKYISGNVITDFASINSVELLPWDGWGSMNGPFEPFANGDLEYFDELAALVNADEFDAMRARYLADDRLRVPDAITSYVNGVAVTVHLDLDD